MRNIMLACGAGLMAAGCGAVAAPLFVGGPGSPIAVGPKPSSPVVADFNGDGRPDVALTCSRPEAPDVGGVLVLITGGAARFARGPAGWMSVGQPVDSLTVADFNGDRNA